MLRSSRLYTTQLQAGLGLLQESRALLALWRPGMSAAMLYDAALASGAFPGVTARRLRNVVGECFAPRYLVDAGAPARHLQILLGRISESQISQLMFLFTARANAVLADFVRHVYWPKYGSGAVALGTDDARNFIQRALDDERMSKRWSESTTSRVSGYLLGVCEDYGLLRRGNRASREIVAPRLSDNVTAYLAHDLHFSGMGDAAVLAHEDWQLFGLSSEDVLSELKRVALKGHLIVQAGGGLTRLSWKHHDMEELCCELG
jgi:hypothetical protein